MRLPRRWVIFIAVALVTVAADQGSKAWAHTLPTPAHCDTAGMIAQTCGGIPQPVISGYWDWELAMNPGAAFSSFIGTDVARLALSLLAMVAVVYIGVLAWRTASDERLKRVALALVAGGALGNLVDRLRYGAVTDFVRWRIGEHRWPIFNVADAALLAGAVLLFLTASSRSGSRRKLKASASLET
jgi:signal peptidase II